MTEKWTFDFTLALAHLKHGKKVARQGWNGQGMYIAMQVPDDHSKMNLPYLYIKNVQGKLVPWVISQSDALSEDWVLIAD